MAGVPNFTLHVDNVPRAQQYLGTLGGIDEQVTELLKTIKPLHVETSSVKQALAKRWLGVDDASAYTTRPAAPTPEVEPPAPPMSPGHFWLEEAQPYTIVCYCGHKNAFLPTQAVHVYTCRCCGAALAKQTDEPGLCLADGCRLVR